MRRVEADSDEMAEQRREAVAIGRGQGRLQDRGDIAAQMRGIAGTEQYDIDPGLMPYEAIGRIDDAARAALVNQKTQRIGIIGKRLRYQAIRRELTHRRGKALGAGKDVAHR